MLGVHYTMRLPIQTKKTPQTPLEEQQKSKNRNETSSYKDLSPRRQERSGCPDDNEETKSDSGI